MSYSMPVDWKTLLQEAEWIEFEHNGDRFRTTNYNLDGGKFIAIHKFVGLDKCKEGNGWAGQSWCSIYDSIDNWPSKSEAQSIIDSNKPEEDSPQGPQPEKITTPSQNRAVDGIPLPPPGEKRYN